MYQFEVKFEGQTRVIQHKLADVTGEIYKIKKGDLYD